MKAADSSKKYGIDPKTRELVFGKFRIRLPRSKRARVGLGAGLIAGGTLGFLPVLGFWMVPLGLIVLSHDLSTVRRWRRRSSVWWARRRK